MATPDRGQLSPSQVVAAISQFNPLAIALFAATSATTSEDVGNTEICTTCKPAQLANLHNLQTCTTCKPAQPKPMEIEILRNLSIIWLSLFCIAGLLVPIVGLYFAVRGMNQATTKLPTLLGSVQTKTHALRGHTDRISTRIAEPVLAAQNRLTKTNKTIRALGSSKPNQPTE